MEGQVRRSKEDFLKEEINGAGCMTLAKPAHAVAVAGVMWHGRCTQPWGKKAVVRLCASGSHALRPSAVRGIRVTALGRLNGLRCFSDDISHFGYETMYEFHAIRDRKCRVLRAAMYMRLNGR
jgi:hypothetical protein